MLEKLIERREFLLGGASTIVLGSLPLSAYANPFPASGKPIRIIIPAPPGGLADLLARAIATHLSRQLNNAPVIVESKPGGASVPAALYVARAPADGYTLFLGLNTTHTQVPHMFRQPPFDPFQDFTAITQVCRTGSVLVAHPSLPVDDLPGLIEYSKQGEQPIPAGSPGPGTNGHLYIVMLNQQYGAKLNHVPYKGSADALRDLLGGFTKLLFDAPATSLPHLRSHRLKPLAVTGTTRLEALPSIKTAREQGFSALEITGWMGIFAPPKMLPELLERLNRELVTAIRHPEMKALFDPLGVELTGSSVADFQKTVRNDYEIWGRIIAHIGVKLD